MKFGYKVLIVLAVFIGAMIYFNGDIQHTVFSISAPITTMSEPTLPVVTIDVNGNEINLLHGYVSNLDEMIMRETITPLTSNRTFTVLIDGQESDVKKLKYEILNEDGEEIEGDSFTVLDVENGPKKVKITLKETMKSGAEYVAKFTLITNKSKRIYYYTRLKMYDNGNLEGKLKFAEDFHRTLINGTTAQKEALKPYLESSKKSDNTTFANVNIKSSFFMVTWGELDPTLLWEEIPTITEFYDNMASIQLKSVVAVETETGIEHYVVKENFRFNYTEKKTYLYNYERRMEALFDVSNTSLVKNEFKLGITNDIDVDTACDKDGKYVAFVYNRELMLYDSEHNNLVNVFSFANGNDYSRSRYDAHEVKLIKVHDNGDVDFCVYGYMNRGEYEGRVGIVLYKYIEEDERIEEKLYIPISSSYQILNSDMTDFMYLSEKDVLYFALYDCIYSYDLVTAKLQTIATNVPEENMFFCKEDKYLCWQNKPDVLEADALLMLDLELGTVRQIDAPLGQTVRLYGRINNNIVYGIADHEDIHINADGSRELPAYRLIIEDKEGNQLKSYSAEGYYINGIELGDNMMIINRLTKKLGTDNIYQAASSDSIMNRYVENKGKVSISRRITDRILTEYYVSLPANINIEEKPTQTKAVSTIINNETTARISEPEVDRVLLYYAYSFGEVVYASPNAAEVINAADAAVGTVINKDGRLIWERGVKSGRYEIANVTGVPVSDTMTSVQASIATLLKYKELDLDASQFDREETNIYSWLRTGMKSGVPVNLTGATMDEVLYYVYKGRPVLAIKDDNNACVLTGYDATGVSYYDPVRKKVMKGNTKDMAESFGKAGNIFISYVN